MTKILVELALCPLTLEGGAFGSVEKQQENHNQPSNRVPENECIPQQLKTMIDEKETTKSNAVCQANYNICEFIDCNMWNLSIGTKAAADYIKAYEHKYGKNSSRHYFIAT